SITPRLKSASDQGMAAAQLTYSQRLIATNLNPSEEIKSEYVELVRRAKASGNANAIFWSGYDGLKGVNGQDKVQSVADLMVAEAVFRKFGVRLSTAKIVEKEYQLLYPDQREDAMALAREMVASDTCCNFMSVKKSWEERLAEE
ncbi:MAG: hypothetical protein AAGA84_04490, partial [Pseudomonadota bacterium]